MRLIILKHLFRSIRSSRFKSILVIVSIAVTSAVFYLNLNIHDDMVENTLKIYQGATSGFDVVVSGKIQKDDLVIPPDEGKVFLEQTAGMTELPEKNDLVQTVVFKGDSKQLVSNSIIKTETELALNDNEAIISSFNADYFGLAIGDIVQVRYGQYGFEEYTITAVLDSLGLFNNNNTDVLELIVQDLNSNSNLCFVKLADDSNLNDVCEKIKEDNPLLEVSSLYDGSGSGNTYNNINNILLVILIFVLISSVFVIASTIRLIIESRIPGMATFRSVGATENKIGFLIRAESIIYGLIGGVVGTALGEIIRIYLRLNFFELTAGSLRINYVLIVPVFSVAVSLLVSSFYISKSTKRSIKDLLFNKQNTTSVYPAKYGFAGVLLFALSFAVETFNKDYNLYLLIIELVLAIAGIYLFTGTFSVFMSKIFSFIFRRRWTPCLWLACKNNETSKINRNSSVLISMVISLLIAIYITITSLTVFFDKYAENYPYDLMIKGLEQPSEMFRDIENLEGVENIKFEFWNFSSKQYINGEKQELCFVSNEGYSNGITYEQGSPENLENGHLIVDRLLAGRKGWHLGDSISTEGFFSVSGVIDGFCDSSIFNSKRTTIIMTHEDYLNSVEKNPSILGVEINSDEDKVIIELNKALKEKHEAKAAIYNVNEFVGEEFNDAMNGLKLASAVPVLIVVLVVFGLVNNQLISFVQKKRIYAVLYSTSMSRSKLVRMMFWELLGTFINGCITGAVLSIRLATMLRNLIYISVAYIPLTFKMSDYILPLIYMFVGLCITSLFPISRLKKMRIVQEVQYE